MIIPLKIFDDLPAYLDIIRYHARLRQEVLGEKLTITITSEATEEQVRAVREGLGSEVIVTHQIKT